MSKGQKGLANGSILLQQRLHVIGGGGKMNLEMRARDREEEHFGGYMMSHRRFYSREVIR